MALSSSSGAASDQNKSQIETKQQATNPEKTCHQCRHKPRSVAAACKNQRNNKPCTLLFCHNCLLNRYGEKAEEVEELEAWSCPKCRGICNCSYCMKKRGQLPTGILCRRAKAAGYSSVSELLNANGPENFGLVKNAKDTGASSKKRGASENETSSPRKKGKENLFDGKVDINMESATPVSVSRNLKLKELEKMQDETLEVDGMSKCSPDRKLKKVKQLASNMLYAGQKDASALGDVQREDPGADVPLPLGTELTAIGDVTLPLKDVGNALQFLEFCAAFGKALNMKKGQSSIILQELINGQRTLRRSTQHSAVVRFHIQLLSLLQKESGSWPQNLSSSHGKNSWLLALKNCISQSANAMDSLPIDCLDSETGGYNTLDSSTKLRILIFLCDEVLGTLTIREWINDQELKFAEKAKQAKESVIAAKDKEKSLKQKVMNELANANIAKDGASLSVSEHDQMVRQIQSEATQAHKEILELMKMVPKTKERAKAVRTQPIFLDVDGRAFWRLNGYSDESSILVQDIGNGDDSVTFGEKWVAFDDEQEKVVEKHISFRGRRVRTRPIDEIIPSQSDV